MRGLWDTIKREQIEHQIILIDRAGRPLGDIILRAESTIEIEIESLADATTDDIRDEDITVLMVIPPEEE